MGLDMYLKAKTHLTNFEFNDQYKKEKALNTKIKEVLGVSHLNNENSSIEVTIGVAYWRKANAIHNWFVECVQNGIDECQESYVSREQLTDLRDVCDEVYKSRDASKLPPASGFFFGSTAVDDWYFQDVLETRDVLTSILNDEALKDFDFYYRASW